MRMSELSARSGVAIPSIKFYQREGLVSAGEHTETGMSQLLPKTEAKTEVREQSKNIEVSITPTSIVLNGSPLQLPEFAQRIAEALKLKTIEADRIVVVKSAPETPYPTWIGVSQAISQAGGILTLELESQRTINVE